VHSSYLWNGENTRSKFGTDWPLITGCGQVTCRTVQACYVLLLISLFSFMLFMLPLIHSSISSLHCCTDYIHSTYVPWRSTFIQHSSKQ